MRGEQSIRRKNQGTPAGGDGWYANEANKKRVEEAKEKWGMKKEGKKKRGKSWSAKLFPNHRRTPQRNQRKPNISE